uniref:hypothetical protein n=1 Tax=Alloprevotella sp. TaxID=1872471 RepID=UPI003FF058CB
MKHILKVHLCRRIEKNNAFFFKNHTRMFLREMCKKILFYPTKSGHNLPYRGEVRHERKLTWGRRVPEAAEKSPDVG